MHTQWWLRTSNHLITATAGGMADSRGSLQRLVDGGDRSVPEDYVLQDANYLLGYADSEHPHASHFCHMPLTSAMMQWNELDACQSNLLHVCQIWCMPVKFGACLSNLVQRPLGHGKKCMQQLLSIGEATHEACNRCPRWVNVTYHAWAADPTVAAFVKVCVVGNSWSIAHTPLMSCTHNAVNVALCDH